MKYALLKKAQKLSATLLPCLLLATEDTSAQCVEVSFQVEATSWPLTSGQGRERQKTYTGRCIFGTNGWLIEGEFSLNSKETWWCTGTNIFKNTVITKELPKREETFGLYAVTPHVGERFSKMYGPSDSQPLDGIAYFSWLAFCSGSFLKSDGHRILPPFPSRENSGAYSDKTQLFHDALGLPERVELYCHDKDLVFVYRVLQSTNFSGWIVPVRFELTQNQSSDGETLKPRWRGSATVTCIRKSAEPLVPPIR
jgi:hypothetical protein